MPKTRSAEARRKKTRRKASRANPTFHLINDPKDKVTSCCGIKVKDAPAVALSKALVDGVKWCDEA